MGATTSTSITDTPTAIVALAKLRTESEDYADLIIKDYPSRTSPERIKAEQLYIAARGSVNGWIAAYKFSLANNDPDPQSDIYKQAQQNAIADGQSYISYMNSIYDKGAVSAQSLSLIGEVEKIISDFVTQVKQEDNEKRKEILALLDTLQWKAWEAPAPVGTAAKAGS